MTEGSEAIPFKVACYLGSAAAGLTVTVEAIEPFSKADVARLDEALTTFGRAAAVGMFSGAAPRPRSVRFGMDRDPVSATTLRYRVNTPVIDVGASRVLLNMLARTHQLGPTLVKATISVGAEAKRTVRITSLEYPKAAADLGFRWRVAEVDHPYKNRVVEIEFSRDLQGAEIDSVLNSIAIWDDVVRRAGYAPDFAAIAEEQSFLGGESYPIHPSIVEHSLDWVTASEPGYYGLVNLIGRVHETIAPVARVEVS